MKKVISLFVTMFSIVMMLVSCTESTGQSTYTITFDTNGVMN